MKRIIEGHRYDSDTARVVGTWDNRLDKSDFYWVQETLHCTRAGLYFVHGEGGARTRYATLAGQNAWTSGEMIVTYSADSARTWAEEHLTSEEYEAEWGTPEEGEVRAMTVRVPESVYRAIREASAAQGCSMGKFVTDALLSGNL